MPDKIATRLKEVRQRGMLYRVAEVVAVNREARTVELAFSSETPVPRWFGSEILSHDPAHVRMGRLHDGAALLWNHKWDDQRGVIESASIDKDRKGRAVARLSKNPAGEELLTDLEDGIKRHVSVGYMVYGMKLVEERDGVDVYLIDDWEPYEISIVSVPADTAVGVGRAAEIPHEEPAAEVGNTGDRSEPATPSETRTNNTAMNEKTLRDASGNLVRAKVDDDGNIVEVLETLERAGEAANAARRSGADAERSRVRAINEMADKYGKAVPNAAELARKAVTDGASAEDFRSVLLDAFNARAAQPLNEQAAGADIGLSEREAQQYSLLRVVRALVDPTNKAAQRDAEFEFRASEAARDKAGKDSEHFFIPSDVLRRAVVGSMDFGRAFNTNVNGGAAGNTGGNAIATTLMAGSFIDILRNRATIMQMASVVGGLVGNIDIPKQVAAAQGYWLGEDDDTTETGIELGQIAMTPKTVGAFSEITRRLLMQSSLDVEAMVRRDLATALALTIDRAGYYGVGSDNQPLGITNVTGINGKDFTGVQPTFAELVDMETAIALDNADVNSMRYVANAAFRGYAKQTLKFAGVAGTVWEPGNTVNGYGCEITNQIATGDVVMGNFADLLVGMWGGLELMVDPYSNSKKGRLRLVVFQDVDFAVRRAESFCIGRKPA